MKNPFSIVKDFEDAVAEYTGAPYCVAINSCTNALFLCLMRVKGLPDKNYIEIPKRTYVSVPQQIKHAGFELKFRNENWDGVYQLQPFNIFDSAKRFTQDMYHLHPVFGKGYMCTSHHWSKTLGIQQGGTILCDNIESYEWFKRARFDGRTEGVAPKDDQVQIGWHCYMSPEVAAEGLVRLHHLPKHNSDMPRDDYPDLSQMEIFK